MDEIDIEQAVFYFENLKESINQDVLSIKLFVIPVIGISLRTGEECEIGSVKFVNNLDFIDHYHFIFNEKAPSTANNNLLKRLRKVLLNANTIALVKIKNRDSIIAKEVKEEVIKRVYTLIKLLLPRIGSHYSFVGTLGDKYLDTTFSAWFQSDNFEKLTSLELKINQTANYFTSNEENLLELMSKYKLDNDNYQDGTQWLQQVEFIITKYVNGEETTDFQKRVWTALYWLGETMIEKEINSLIIKYATCLEALFNSREGGISEQISEFTAFIVGKSKDQRINIYDDVKNLYKLRSKAVHGGSTGITLNDKYLVKLQNICEYAVIYMSHYSLQEAWQGSKGYQNFIRYILREYRFS